MISPSFPLVFGMGILCLTPAKGWSDESLLPPMNGQASDFAPRRAGVDANASIRIGVTNEAIYRITQATLTNAGAAASSLIGANLRLFCRTQEVAIYVSNTGLWNTNDYLLFPGSGFSGSSTITNIYWLGFGSGGKRMGSRSVTPLAGNASVLSCRKTVTHNAPYFLDDAYRWDDESFDHWVDALMIMDSVSRTYPLITDQIVAGDPADFNAVLYGKTSLDAVIPDHCTQILVNGTEIGRFFYDGQVTASVITNFAGSWLRATNTIFFQQIRQSGVPVDLGDQAYLAHFSMTYSRSLIQEQNALLFNGRVATTNYQVGGFTSSTNFYAFDISDPANAVMLTGLQTTNTGAGTYAVRFGDSSAVSSRYAVCHTSGIKAASFVERTFFRDLASTNRQADYIIICPYAFRSQVYRLLKWRYAQGLSVAVVPLPDLFNEFSYGIADAAAIKQFIGYAFHHWVTPPKYVLLAGIGTYDPKHNNSSWTLPDIIPVHMGPGYKLWAALDGWYATVKGADNVPDVALGRIPVRTEIELSNVISKIMTFEGIPSNDSWRTEALLVADSKDGGLDFRAASEAVRNNDLPIGFLATPAYKGYLDGNSAFIVGEINYGKFLVNYFGHGAPDLWTDTPYLLTTSDVNGLNNNPFFPIVAMLTCANGDFQDPNRPCLVETFLKNANSGASACLASTGLATLDSGQHLASGFYRSMLTDRHRRIGDSLLPAYTALYLQSGNTRELLSFELFGDPAMVVNPP